MDKERFLRQEVGEEVVLFDAECQVYHSLSEKAEFIRCQVQSGASEDSVVSAVKAKFPQHVEDAEELVTVSLEGLRERGILEDSDNKPLTLGRRKVLKFAGATLLATALATPAAATASGRLQVTLAEWASNGVIRTACFGGGASPSPPATNGSVLNGAIQAQLIAQVSDGPAQSVISVGLVTSAFFGGVDPSSVNQNRLSVQHSCNGVPQPTIQVCEGAALMITCLDV